MSKQSKYLAIFQVGPVQEFIQSAKKTLDYWSGSFLLSNFCAVAIRQIGRDDTLSNPPKERVIFPSVAENPLFKHIDSTNAAFPWSGRAEDDVYRPSIPNRLFCLLEGCQTDVSEALDKARRAVDGAWEQIQTEILLVLDDQGIDDVWRNIWKRQVKKPFEILHVWLEWPQDSGIDYPAAYRRTESLMGSRKATRWFEAEPPEEGHKCSLCGIREALHLSHANPHITRKDIRDDWDSIVQPRLRFSFRKGETLCAVCTVKRLAPRFVFRKALDIPSTSTVATAATVESLIANRTNALQCCVDAFVRSIRDIRQADVDEPAPGKSDPLPKHKDAPGFDWVDGDWFYDNHYRNLKLRYAGKAEKLDRADTARKSLFEMIESTLEEKKVADMERPETAPAGLAQSSRHLRCLPPTKYYAVLVADGDDMGERLGSMRTIEEHEELSRRLAAFSTSQAIDVLQTQHLGYVVYFGGDEGAAFLALEDLLDAMGQLRKRWGEYVEAPLAAGGIGAPTLSVGVSIAHHQDGLRGAVAAAHEAIHAAKSLPGKDSFCITLNRRSSGTFTCRSRWSYDGFEVLPFLECFVEAYRGNDLSPAWIQDFRREAGALGDPREDLQPSLLHDWITSRTSLCVDEAARIMRRHSQREAAGDIVQRLIDGAGDLLRKLESYSNNTYNRNRFQDFLTLMDVAQYVAKGGGQ